MALLAVGAAVGFIISGRMGAPAVPDASHAGMEAQPQKASGETSQGKPLYQCPMHPNYFSEKPGDCPICNMTLVPVKTGETAAATSTVEGHATVTISQEKQQLIGVQTGLVSREVVRKRTRAVGMVIYDERGLSTVNLKFSGWVERLFVKATGDAVHKGEPLMEVYSPEILEAQRNYLLALESLRSLGANASSEARAFAAESVDSARERLLLWDMTPEQIKELEQRKDPARNVTILSKAEGVVIVRNVVEGAAVESGKDLYQIADLSTVWIEADMYEYEISLVKVGDEMKVTLSSYPGEEIAGKVAYVYPYLNSQTRTVRVRFEIPNPDGKLKPGMYGAVFLETDLGEQLVVDEGAILDTGTRQIVFVVKRPGVFEPREVVAGQSTDGHVVILKGLEAGEMIVTSGNFLVDSESRLRFAASGGGMAGMPGMAGMEMPGAGQAGKAGSTGGTEGKPGMGAPAAKPKEGGMEGMPGM